MGDDLQRPLSDVWHLRDVDWLRELSPDELRKLEAASSRRDYRQGEVVFAPESSPHSLYLLESGLVRIYRLSGDGAEATFGYVAPGEVFGELAAFGDYPRESFAEAARESRVWRLQASFFRELLASRPSIVLEVTRQIGNRFKRMESRVEDLVFRDVRSRLAHVLLELSQDLGRPLDGTVVIQVELTQSELATLVGSTRQTVNSVLREFEGQGITGRRGRRIALLRVDELERVARAPAGV